MLNVELQQFKDDPNITINDILGSDIITLKFYVRRMDVSKRYKDNSL